MDAQFRHQFCAVIVDRLWTERQSFGNLRVGVPFRDKMQNLAFPLGNLGAIFKALHDAQNGGGEISSARKNKRKTGLNVFGRTAFERDTIHSRGDPLGQMAPRGYAGDEADARIGGPPANLDKDLHPARHRHVAVERKQIRCQRFTQGDGFQSVTGFGDDFGMWNLGQDTAQGVAHNHVVIREHHGAMFSSGSCR